MTDPTTREGLEPCPFCGATDVATPMYDKPYTWIECGKCFVQGPVSANGKEAREAWNRRAPVDTTRAEGGVAEVKRYSLEWIEGEHGGGYVVAGFDDLPAEVVVTRASDYSALAAAHRAAVSERDALRAKISNLERINRALGEVANRQWQPIETAPKDGTVVHLYWPTLSIAQYPAVGIHHGDEYGWELLSDRDFGEIMPTHWQPLPAPPGAGI